MVVVTRASGYLEHHGIQGQKWGVRNGPPYPLDYEDHNASEKSKNPKGSLDNYEKNNPVSKAGLNTPSNKKKKDSKDQESEKKSFHDRRKEALMKKGLTEEEAESQIAFENRAAIIAASCAAIIGASVAYNMVRAQGFNNDFVISAGTEMFRVSASDSSSVRDMFYATTDKFDATKYAGLYAKQLRTPFFGGKIDADVYQKIMSSKSDIKVAGANASKAVFEELKQLDPNFRKAVRGTAFEEFTSASLFDGKNTGANRKFFEALQSKGYGGMLDLNDYMFGGYESNKPVILFNQGDNVHIDSVRKLANSEINKNTAVGVLAQIGQGYLKDTKTVAWSSILSGVVAGKKYAESLNNEEVTKTGKKK